VTLLKISEPACTVFEDFDVDWSWIQQVTLYSSTI